MKSGVYFWGTFLISTGTFLLMNNFGKFHIYFDEIIDWWPVLLIIWGASMLKIPLIIKNILLALSGIFFSLLVVSMFTGGCNCLDDIKTSIDFSKGTEVKCTKSEDKPDSKVKHVELNFSGGAGKFEFSTTDDYLYYLSSASNKCDIDSEYPNDSTIVINYDFSEGKNIKNEIVRYSELKLLKKPQWDIVINAGASKLDLDLIGLRIANLSIDAGASDITLKLGALMPMTKVNIDCGAAKLKIEVPANAGCSVQGDMALSKTLFSGLKQNSAGVFISENYYESNNKIDFTIDGVISNIDLTRK